MVHFIRHQYLGILATLTTRRQHDYVMAELSKVNNFKGVTSYTELGREKRKIMTSVLFIGIVF